VTYVPHRLHSVIGDRMKRNVFVKEANLDELNPCPSCGAEWKHDARVHSLECEYVVWLDAEEDE
jgi:hypothetical protein